MNDISSPGEPMVTAPRQHPNDTQQEIPDKEIQTVALVALNSGMRGGMWRRQTW
jgi:hypothetical protein